MYNFSNFKGDNVILDRLDQLDRLDLWSMLCVHRYSNFKEAT